MYCPTKRILINGNPSSVPEARSALLQPIRLQQVEERLRSPALAQNFVVVIGEVDEQMPGSSEAMNHPEVMRPQQMSSLP